MVELKRKRNFHTTVDEQSFDLEQGDPCAAAEGRLKRGIKRYTVFCCCILVLLALAVVVVIAIFVLPLINDKLFWSRDGGEGTAKTDRAQWEAASSRPTGTLENEAAHSSTDVEAQRTDATTMALKSTAPSPSTHPATTSGPSLTPLTSEQSTAASVSTTAGAAATTRQEVQTSGPTTPPPPTIKRPAPTGALLPFPGDQSTVHCGDYYQRGDTTSTVYKLRLPEVGDFHAYCEMVDGDGWMVLQRRSGPEPPLFWDATFDEYASGFGNVSGDHWLGLERVHALGRNHRLQLRIIVNGDFCVSKDYCSGLGAKGRWQGDWMFKIADRADGYRMEELSYISGTLSHPHNDFFSASALKQRFTTIDVDNDGSSGVNCAKQKRRGGWWHGSCKASLGFLNGQYNGGTAESGSGDIETGEHQFWTLWRDGSTPYRIKPMSSVMMVRMEG